MKSPQPFRNRALHIAIRCVVGGAALGLTTATLAQDTAQESVDPIPVILITLGLDEDTTLVTSPYSILDQDEIIQTPGTFGDLLSSLPGVHADNFGGGSSRPVIRGQTSPRVTVLSDGAGILDASAVSPDHTVTVDPLLARRIEVLRGPATLLYGGGAIGGVVNVLDNKVPSRLPEDRATATMGIRGDTVAGERAGAASITAQAGENFAWHFEGSTRDTNDYKARGYDEPRVDGTYSDSRNASIGGSWIGESGFLGLAYSYRSDMYGIPGHSEEYEDCHPHGDHLDCGDHDDHGHGGHDDHDDHDDHDEHDHDHHDHEVPFVDLDSRRYDLRGEWNNPMAGIHRVRIRASHTDYRHFEIEEDDIKNEYTNKGYEGRIEIDHAPIGGMHGVVGMQFSDTTFAALGSEAFIPETDSRSAALFVVEHYELTDQWHFEAGARYETMKLSPRNDERNRPTFDSSAFSYSAAAIWAFDSNHTLAATYARAQRLPGEQELYARGVHLATNTYECGLIPHPLTCGGTANNAPISRETSHNIDLTLRRHTGDLTYAFNVFRNNVDDYIYARTLDQYEGFRLIKYTQSDATLKGFEAEISYQLTDTWSVSAFADQVRASIDNAGNLPRISPNRAGLRTEAQLTHGLTGQLSFTKVSSQNRIADFESVTPGYDMVNASLNYDVTGNGEYMLFLRGSNLLDEEVRNHTSFLANVTPMPGRNISGGFRIRF